MGAAGAQGRRSIRNRRDVGQIRQLWRLIVEPEVAGDGFPDLGGAVFIETGQFSSGFAVDGQVEFLFLGKGFDRLFHVRFAFLDDQHLFAILQKALDHFFRHRVGKTDAQHLGFVATTEILDGVFDIAVADAVADDAPRPLAFDKVVG